MYIYEKDGKLNMIFGKEGSLQIPAGSVLSDGTKLYENEDETYNLTSYAPEVSISKDAEEGLIIASIGTEEIEGNVPEEPTLTGIEWSTPPTKISYNSGETLDLTGAVITATYSDESEKDVTALCTFDPADGTTLTAEMLLAGITATYEDQEATIEFGK